MNVFSTKTATPLRAAPDPFKHVNYTYGMVLGAEDFGQEFTYLSARDHWITRDLIGYGTVSGLGVTFEPNGDKPRLVVAPGVAVTPRGEMVRVPRAQCAYLNDWLKSEEVAKRADAAKSSATVSRLEVFITLCYRECETDDMPIPGEPCRDEADMMAASRVADDFKLDLRFSPPDQPDERAVRDFVQWLSGIPIVDGPSSMSLAKFLDSIRYAATLIDSPPSSPPDFMYGTPPPAIRIGRGDVCRYLRAAYRIWAVELRNKWYASWWNAQAHCGSSRPEAGQAPEPCVLLARVGVPVVMSAISGTQVWEVSSSSDPVIDDEDRPFLIPLRMLQEWLWCGCTCATTGTGSVVAAGFLKVTTPPQPASGPDQLQALRPSVVPPGPPAWTVGDFWVLFNGYQQPTSSSAFAYVVTVTPLVGATTSPRLEVAAFDPEGIRLRLNSNARPASPADLEFMIEVTRYMK